MASIVKKIVFESGATALFTICDQEEKGFIINYEQYINKLINFFTLEGPNYCLVFDQCQYFKN